MEDAFALLSCILLSIVLQWPAARVYHLNRALEPWRGLLAISALVWAWMPAFQFYIVTKNMGGDWVGHERISRDIAESLLANNFSNIYDLFGYGNPGYRFLFGLLYAITGVPSITPYVINAAMAFWGMTHLLHIVCQQTGCERVPLWLILITVFLPSALFWTPINLKEGICLWGICMMLGATLRDPRTGARVPSLLPLFGFFATAFMRPHMAMAFAVAIGLGSLVGEKKLRHALVIGASILIGLQLLQFVRPQIVEGFTEEGFLETVEDTYSANIGYGGSAIYHPGGRPIPVITGLTLIFLRPFPHEINGIPGAMAALEVWFITTICVRGWMRIPNRRRMLLAPFTMTLLVAILFMAFFYSYSYNMGLLVRQRLHVLPAVIALTALPHLLPQKQFPAEDFGLQEPHRNDRQVEPR